MSIKQYVFIFVCKSVSTGQREAPPSNLPYHTSSESSWQLQTDWLKTCLLCILSRNFCNNFFLQKNSPEISKNGLQAHSTIISQSHLHDDSVLYDLVSLQLPDDGVDQLKRRLQRRLPKLNRLLQQRHVSFLTHFFETIDY